MIKAITLHEPWASLVTVGEKKIETRSWRTNYRGKIYIHASQSFPKYAREMLDIELFQSLLIKNKLMTKDAVACDFVCGFVIGSVEIIDCITSENFMARKSNAERFGSLQTYFPIKESHNLLTDESLQVDVRQEYSLGNYDENRFGFVMTNAIRFKKPVRVKGFQRIFNIRDEAIIREIEKQEKLCS